MLPSARERVDSKHNFFKTYFLLCKLNSSVPRLKNDHSKHLEFFSDRIRAEDWSMIIKAISCDQSLKSVRILNYHLLKSGVMRQSAINIVKVLSELITALSKMVSNNKAIETLELQCLSLDTRHISLLTKALKSNNSIHRLGLSHCSIGDEGCKILFNTLRYHPIVNEIDLTACNITEKGADCIAQTIKVQTSFRHAEYWEHSLRYRQPNLKVNHGLRSINLDGNTQLQDSGFITIMNAIIDDIWILEISCKNCGLTKLAAQKAIEAIQKSKISRLDVRQNLKVDSDHISMIEKFLRPNYSSQPCASPQPSLDDIQLERYIHANNCSDCNWNYDSTDCPIFSMNEQQRIPVHVPRLQLPGTKRLNKLIIDDSYSSEKHNDNSSHTDKVGSVIMSDTNALCDDSDIINDSRTTTHKFVMVEKETFETMISSFKHLVNTFNEAKRAGLNKLIIDDHHSCEKRIENSFSYMDKVVSLMTSATNELRYDSCIDEDRKRPTHKFVMVGKESFESIISSFKQLVNTFNEVKSAGLLQETMWKATKVTNKNKIFWRWLRPSMHQNVMGFHMKLNELIGDNSGSFEKYKHYSSSRAQNICVEFTRKHNNGTSKPPVSHKERAQNICMELLNKRIKDSNKLAKEILLH